jgi:hypothetical protein
MDGSDFFKQLHKFFAGATQEKFESVFGEGMGKHLWEKWTGYGFDLIHFLGNLDSPNRAKLFEHIKYEVYYAFEIPF